MLRSLSEIMGYGLQCMDGRGGRCIDFLFDDRDWVIRYLVGETNRWWPKRRVLISTQSVGEPDWDTHLVPIGLRTKELQNSPRRGPPGDLPWMALDPASGEPDTSAAAGVDTEPSDRTEASGKAVETAAHKHAQSVRAIRRYRAWAEGKARGSVEDLIVDDSNWKIRWLVTGTGRAPSARKVMVKPDAVAGTPVGRRELRLNMTWNQLEHSPDYDPSAPINRRYEPHFYDLRGRPWSG